MTDPIGCPQDSSTCPADHWVGTTKPRQGPGEIVVPRGQKRKYLVRVGLVRPQGIAGHGRNGLMGQLREAMARNRVPVRKGGSWKASDGPGAIVVEGRKLAGRSGVPAPWPAPHSSSPSYLVSRCCPSRSPAFRSTTPTKSEGYPL